MKTALNVTRYSEEISSERAEVAEGVSTMRCGLLCISAAGLIDRSSSYTYPP